MDIQLVVGDEGTETVAAMTPMELTKPLPDCVDENKGIVSEICKSVVSEVICVEQLYPVRTVQTQHGDYRTVDEENIVLLHITRSPVPEEQEEFIWFRNKPFEDDSNDADDEVSQSNFILYIRFIIDVFEYQSEHYKKDRRAASNLRKFVIDYIYFTIYYQ